MIIHKTRILIVDDEPESRRNIQKTLEHAGYIIRTAAETNSAVRIIQEEDFDLALVDMVMPDWTGILSNKAGIFLLEKMKEMAVDFPVIMLTAQNDATLAVDSLKRLGATDYLVKGNISTQEFLQIIKQTLSDNQSRG